MGCMEIDLTRCNRLEIWSYHCPTGRLLLAVWVGAGLDSRSSYQNYSSSVGRSARVHNWDRSEMEPKRELRMWAGRRE